MLAFLLSVSLFAPVLGSGAIAALRPAGLTPGRFMTVSCGASSIAALVLLGWSASAPNDVAGETLGFGLGRLSAVLLASVACLALVVASFARRNVDVDPRSARFFVLFGALVTGSLLVVVPGNPLLLLIGWIGSSWALVALVGHDTGLASTRRSQRVTAQALIIGDVALAAAVLVAVIAAGRDVTLDVAGSLGDLRSFFIGGVSALDIVAVLLVIAGISKSSLLPLHRWLVSTLAAPTPVSALVHAGFVSGAGLLMIRFAPIVVDSTVALHAAFVVGVATTVVAVGAAKTRVDVKGKLAWSTVSQMGFMVVQCAVGAFSSAVFHIVGHGMYKASMFLGAGDAVSASLTSKRRAAPATLPQSGVRLAASIGVATAALVIGLLVVPPDVSDGGVILVAVFAWLTVAHGVWGFLLRGALAPAASIGAAASGGVVAMLTYLGGLRAMEAFVEPALRGLPDDAGVDPIVLSVTLVLVALGTAGVAATPALKGRLETWFERTAHPGVAASPHPVAPVGNPSGRFVDVEPADPSELARIRAGVARSQAVIAPAWPLTSVVAVNPLGGLEEVGFDRATEIARRELRVRTHLSLDQYREDHRSGVTSSNDLQRSIMEAFPLLVSLPPIVVGGLGVDASGIVELDLLHGPEADEPWEPQTAIERIEGVDGPIGKMIDLSIGHSAAHYVSASSEGAMSFAERWCRDATSVAGLRRHLPQHSVDWLNSLSDDPAEVISASLAVSGVADDQRIAEMRGQLVRLRGWAGLSRWRSEWAHDDDDRPDLSPIELVAARCALEAAWIACHRDVPAIPASAQPDDVGARRVSAVLSALDVASPDQELVAQVRDIIALVPADGRAAIWLAAQEHNVVQRTLGLLDRLDPGARLDTPAAQLVFCIDVRSEGMRRHLEAAGPYETLGFAGFFGVPMAVRRFEWDSAEARCPVLVAPSVGAVERPRADGHDSGGHDIIARSRRAGGATAVHARTKSGVGAAFVMAEAAGWFAGPVAAVKTLLPMSPRAASQPPTMMEIDRLVDAASDIDQRVDIGEAVLTTMSLTGRFSPLVVLCGHASKNLNNAHATALDCGACAGASGQDNARAVAALLNEKVVREGLRGRGIDIPDGTHFLPGLHDTVSDRVDLYDMDDLPATHVGAVSTLRRDLALVAAKNSAQRAEVLPGRAQSVRQRGTDWAQVRPEWGLAGNTSFVIGPRSVTAGLDLGGRSFLHSYDAEADPEGKVLETIMTAPLIVAHWISSQYYFSTVDPDQLGAGDKLIHNVVGDFGVVSGEHGDLRVGLPLQSTHVGGRHHHQPLRLLAVVQAPLERIEEIIQRNPILGTLLGGSWMRIAGRSNPHERWSIRTPSGTWSAEPRPIDTNPTLEQQ
jgi:uncharacterized protein YbcC (UPF0753/DUF2309 family)/NADH:ubiquinone oxidoreductase subunit 5 (subunit L)/multisubunit Na+/H+ antiporter MnhA subunit